MTKYFNLASKSSLQHISTINNYIGILEQKIKTEQQMQISLFTKSCRLHNENYKNYQGFDQRNININNQARQSKKSPSVKYNQEMDLKQFQKQLSQIGYPLVQVQHQILLPRQVQNTETIYQAKIQYQEGIDEPISQEFIINQIIECKQDYQEKTFIQKGKNLDDLKYQTLKKNMLNLKRENQDLKNKNIEISKQNQYLKKTTKQKQHNYKKLQQKIDALMQNEQDLNKKYQSQIRCFIKQLETVQFQLELVSKENKKYQIQLDCKKNKKQIVNLKQVNSPRNMQILTRKPKFNHSFTQKVKISYFDEIFTQRSNEIIENKIDKLHEQIFKQISILKRNF